MPDTIFEDGCYLDLEFWSCEKEGCDKECEKNNKDVLRYFIEEAKDHILDEVSIYNFDHACIEEKSSNLVKAKKIIIHPSKFYRYYTEIDNLMIEKVFDISYIEELEIINNFEVCLNISSDELYTNLKNFRIESYNDENVTPISWVIDFVSKRCPNIKKICWEFNDNFEDETLENIIKEFDNLKKNLFITLPIDRYEKEKEYIENNNQIKILKKPIYDERKILFLHPDHYNKLSKEIDEEELDIIKIKFLRHEYYHLVKRSYNRFY